MPNPASADSRVEFTLTEAQQVDVGVYDVAGRRVRSLGSAFRAAGAQLSSWDGRDDAGRQTPSGVYFFRLNGANQVLSARVVRIR